MRSSMRDLPRRHEPRGRLPKARLPWLAACAVLALCGGGARAATVSPAGAQAAMQDLRAWVGSLLGPGATAPVLPVQITAAGDHYRIAVPIAGIAAKDGPATISAAARPADDGTWTVDDLQLPRALGVTLGAPAAGPQATGPQAAPGPIAVRIGIAGAQGHAVIDPALRTPSQLDLSLTGVTSDIRGPLSYQTQHIDRYTLDTTLAPDTGGADHGGLLTLSERADIQGWAVTGQDPGAPKVAFGAARVHAAGTIAGIDAAQLRALLAAFADLGREWPDAVALARAHKPPPPAARAALRRVVLASRGILRSFQGEETLDGVRLSVGSLGGGTARHLKIGFGSDAPDGKLHSRISVALDGLAVDGLPPQLAVLVPQQVVLSPSVSDLKLAALTRLAIDATAEHPDPARLAPDMQALFADGGFTMGMDALSVTLGQTRLTGKGEVRILAPKVMQGEARLVATGFAQLMQTARSDPALRQVLPMLAMARGLAKTEGDRLVWQIASSPDGGVTVNGIPFGGPGGGPGRKPAE